MKLSWFVYHFKTFLELIYVFRPFRRKKKRLPLVCIPYGSGFTFVFSIVVSILIYLPLILFVVKLINTKEAAADILIISVVGLVLGTVFRIILAKMVSLVRVDPQKLTLIRYGFFYKREIVIEKKEMSNIVLIKEKYKGIKNYKVCIETYDGKHVLLKLTMIKKRAEEVLYDYGQILKLLVSYPTKRQIINDVFIMFS